MRVTRAKGPFELVEQPIPAPGPGMVRIKVEACGVCHSDSITKEAILPGIQFPRARGHEVAGVVDARSARGSPGGAPAAGGRGLARWTLRVLRFLPARRFRHLPGRVPDHRVSYDGGYADYVIAPAGALARSPTGSRPSRRRR
jgi:alcohol dehydrogenase/propanol-preferring alcohol dehydrogenase